MDLNSYDQVLKLRTHIGELFIIVDTPAFQPFDSSEFLTESLQVYIDFLRAKTLKDPPLPSL
jgi:hypothetical protein